MLTTTPTHTKCIRTETNKSVLVILTGCIDYECLCCPLLVILPVEIMSSTL